jgi:serine/threonine-protein kinase
MLFQWNALAQYDGDGRHRARLQAPGRLSLSTWAYTCRCLDPVRDPRWRVRYSISKLVAWDAGKALPGRPLDAGSRHVPEVTTLPQGARFGHRVDCPRAEVSGAGVAIARYEEKEHRFVAGPDTLVGRTPLRGLSLPRGSYRCVLTPPAGSGLAAVVFPVRIERDGDLSLDVALYPEEQIPPGHVQVPAGPFVCGGEAENVETCEDFFAARTHVTCGEYLEFLNDLCARGAVAEARARQPRGSDRAYWRETGTGGKRRLRLPTRREDRQLAWDLRWPVVAVTWRDAIAWCEWKSRREGRLYTLLTSPEYEKAARGADGRAFPYGDEGDAQFCWASRATLGQIGPCPVGSIAADESPYGILDMAGNAQSWLLTGGHRASLEQRAAKGGAWSLDVDAGHCGRTSGYPTTARRWFLGFRTAVRALAFDARPASGGRPARRKRS